MVTRHDLADMIPKSETTHAFAPNSPADTIAPTQSGIFAPTVGSTTNITGNAI